MALSERVQSIKDWMERGKSLEEASNIVNRNYDIGETETLGGVSVPRTYTGKKEQAAYDLYAEIKKQQAALLAAQKQARINALSGQRESALSALSAERATVAPEYLKQRGTLSTTAQQAARGQEQMLAARGLARGGSAVQGDIARNVALQQGMTDIGQAEAGTLANIAQRQTGAEMAYSQGVAGAKSEAAVAAAQNEIARLMQAQQAQEATQASAAQQQFEAEKMNQEQANKIQIEQLRIAAQEAANAGDFERAKELAKYKTDLEKETIKLSASLKPARASGGGGSGGGSSDASNLNVTQRSLAGAIGKQIDANPGQLAAILSRVTDPAVRAYLQAIYGSANPSASIGQPYDINATPMMRTVTGPSGSSQIPTFLNVRNLPGLG